jgi:hypothetical protein
VTLHKAATGTLFIIGGNSYQEAIWVIAHRICPLVWKILHDGVRYEERGPSVSAKAQRAPLAKMIRELTKAGYRVEAPELAPKPA